MKKKNILAGLLSVMVLGTVSAVPASAADSLYGDTNCDGVVDMGDAVLIMQALANPGKELTVRTPSISLRQASILPMSVRKEMVLQQMTPFLSRTIF